MYEDGTSDYDEIMDCNYKLQTCNNDWNVNVKKLRIKAGRQKCCPAFFCKEMMSAKLRVTDISQHHNTSQPNSVWQRCSASEVE
jgi:hypothetical protein